MHKISISSKATRCQQMCLNVKERFMTSSFTKANHPVVNILRLDKVCGIIFILSLLCTYLLPIYTHWALTQIVDSSESHPLHPRWWNNGRINPPKLCEEIDRFNKVLKKGQNGHLLEILMVMVSSVKGPLLGILIHRGSYHNFEQKTNVLLKSSLKNKKEKKKCKNCPKMKCKRDLIDKWL